jgi:acyl-CoA thioester hydrolase
VARVESLRSLGISYKKLEDEGVLLPVVDFNIKYKKPAFYDDELTVKCEVSEMPTVKITFNYTVFRDDDLLNIAQTTLVFLNEKTGKPMKIPFQLKEKFNPYFNIN